MGINIKYFSAKVLQPSNKLPCRLRMIWLHTTDTLNNEIMTFLCSKVHQERHKKQPKALACISLLSDKVFKHISLLKAKDLHQSWLNRD